MVLTIILFFKTREFARHLPVKGCCFLLPSELSENDGVKKKGEKEKT